MNPYGFERPEMVDFVPLAARQVLDVGCNTGAFGALLKARGPEVVVTGLEPDPDAAAAASKVLDTVVQGHFPDASADLRLDDGYDAIVFNDVLEHMSDPADALAAAEGLLSTQGVVVASIPNVRHATVVAPLLIRGSWNYRDIGVLDRTHLRFFTESTTRQLFEGSGWSVELLVPLDRKVRLTDPGPPRWVRLLGFVSRGWTDPFFVVQYAVVAHPQRRYRPRLAQGDDSPRSSA